MPEKIKEKIQELLNDVVEINDIKYESHNSQFGKHHCFTVDFGDDEILPEDMNALLKEFPDVTIGKLVITMPDKHFITVGGNKDIKGYDNKLKQCILSIREKTPEDLIQVLMNSALANDLLEVDIKYHLYANSYSIHTYYWSVEKEMLVDNSHVDDVTCYISPEEWLTGGLYPVSIRKGLAQIIEIRNSEGEELYSDTNSKQTKS